MSSASQWVAPLTETQIVVSGRRLVVLVVFRGMRVTLLDRDSSGDGFWDFVERRMFWIPALLRVEDDSLPCAVELRLSYASEQVILTELKLVREPDKPPINSKTLRLIPLEAVRRVALTYVTSALVRDESGPFGWRPLPAPFDSDDKTANPAVRAVSGLDDMPKRTRGSTRRAIKKATSRPRRTGRARSLNDNEMKTLARLVNVKRATVHEVRAKFPWLSRTTAYRLMATVRDEKRKR